MNSKRYAVMVHCPEIGVDMLDSFGDERQAEKERDKAVGQPLRYPLIVDGYVAEWVEAGIINGAWIEDQGTQHVL